MRRGPRAAPHALRVRDTSSWRRRRVDTDVRLLLAANALLAVLIGAHIADHTLHQHMATPAALTGPGVAGAIAVVASLALTLSGRREAAPFAALVGIATAVGFVAIHLAPHWSLFSDSYFEHHRDALSWASMLGALAAALLLTAAAARAMDEQRSARTLAAA